jgi:predicted ArsR family transcriptional regulator
VFIAAHHVSDAADGANPGPHGLEARTRDRVRRTISEDGPLTAAALATRLGLTPAAVRRHLDLLAEQGAIEKREPPTAGAARRLRGRPARAYILSEAGHAGLDSDYDHVATSALHFLAAHAGEDAVREFARERNAELEQRYAAQLAEAGEDVTARTEALATALTADGFAASTRPVGAGTPLAGVQLCQGHCPVQHVAAQFPQFCDAETDAFSRLLGVHVQRLATLAHGEHVCTTFIPLSAGPVQAVKAVVAHPGKAVVAQPGPTTSDEGSSQ